MDKPAPSLEVKTNQQGQALGRKGQETRRRLMDAARKLLESYSPVELTAVAIAKEAKTSSASFYMYFEDVRDVLYALAVQAGAEMREMHAIVEEPWERDQLQQQALRLVESLWDVWDRHRQVLRFRNMEADRGDPRFEALRMSTYVPFIDMLGRRIASLTLPDQPKPSLSHAFALASVLHSSIERLASTDPAVVARGLGSKKLHAALAHVIVLVCNGAGLPDEMGVGTPTRKRSAARPRPASKSALAKLKSHSEG
jgi:AcrR family transcriptional regulator